MSAMSMIPLLVSKVSTPFSAAACTIYGAEGLSHFAAGRVGLADITGVQYPDKSAHIMLALCKQESISWQPS